MQTKKQIISIFHIIAQCFSLPVPLQALGLCMVQIAFTSVLPALSYYYVFRLDNYGLGPQAWMIWAAVLFLGLLVRQRSSLLATTCNVIGSNLDCSIVFSTSSFHTCSLAAECHGAWWCQRGSHRSPPRVWNPVGRCHRRVRHRLVLCHPTAVQRGTSCLRRVRPWDLPLCCSWHLQCCRPGRARVCWVPGNCSGHLRSSTAILCHVHLSLHGESLLNYP